MVTSFITTAYALENALLSIQFDGWKVVSINPMEEKKYDRESRMYVDKNLFVVVVENEKLKPVKYWRVEDEEFYTRKEAWDYAESKELSPYCHVEECYDYVEVEEDV